MKNAILAVNCLLFTSFVGLVAGFCSDTAKIAKICPQPINNVKVFNVIEIEQQTNDKKFSNKINDDITNFKSLKIADNNKIAQIKNSETEQTAYNTNSPGIESNLTEKVNDGNETNLQSFEPKRQANSSYTNKNTASLIIKLSDYKSALKQNSIFDEFTKQLLISSNSAQADKNNNNYINYELPKVSDNNFVEPSKPQYWNSMTLKMMVPGSSLPLLCTLLLSYFKNSHTKSALKKGSPHESSISQSSIAIRGHWNFWHLLHSIWIIPLSAIVLGELLYKFKKWKVTGKYVENIDGNFATDDKDKVEEYEYYVQNTPFINLPKTRFQDTVLRFFYFRKGTWIEKNKDNILIKYFVGNDVPQTYRPLKIGFSDKYLFGYNLNLKSYCEEKQGYNTILRRVILGWFGKFYASEEDDFPKPKPALIF